jgi:hypothetical protein
MEKIKISNENENPSGLMIIKDVYTSSPDVQVYLSDDRSFPLTIHPKQSANIGLIINSEQIGRFDAVIYIHFEKHIYVTTIKAVAHPNKFGF